MAAPIETPAPEEDLSLDDDAEPIRPHLLAADEVGPGFTPGEEPVSDASVPAIRRGPNAVAQRSRSIDPFVDKIEEWVDRSNGHVRADGRCDEAVGSASGNNGEGQPESRKRGTAARAARSCS